jgi:hypothetical protein
MPYCVASASKSLNTASSTVSTYEGGTPEAQRVNWPISAKSTLTAGKMSAMGSCSEAAEALMRAGSASATRGAQPMRRSSARPQLATEACGCMARASSSPSSSATTTCDSDEVLCCGVAGALLPPKARSLLAALGELDERMDRSCAGDSGAPDCLLPVAAAAAMWRCSMRARTCSGNRSSTTRRVNRNAPRRRAERPLAQMSYAQKSADMATMMHTMTAHALPGATSASRAARLSGTA